ncbi:DNA glycosylase [Ramicandelaber brevisporus]|nr:DNA glycosylase [Ramicandelaber brevisporus]
MTSPASGKAPSNWESVYADIETWRASHTAPVDTMGCAKLGDPLAPPADFRFQTLVSLMLSAMTKDATTAAAFYNLKSAGYTSAATFSKATAEDIDKCISKVGFHARKAKYIRETAAICVDKFDGDIPRSVEGLVELPGVGPKMAHLAMQAAWKDNELGIGVDVHVHRIANRLKWTQTPKGTSTPEATRIALEKWLPKNKWAAINPLFVGFGQLLCEARAPKCGECPVADRCPSSTVKKGKRKPEPESEPAQEQNETGQNERPRRRQRTPVVVEYE